MFDILYNKRVVDVLELIRSDNVLLKKYEALEKQLENDPYQIVFQEVNIPKDIHIMNSIRSQYHYIELFYNVRILYRICEQDSSVEIAKIDIEN
jgi:hypothetical protein